MTALSDSVKTEGSVKLHARVNPSTGNTGKWRYPTALILGHVIPSSVNRWFCADCGAHLISQSSGHPERTFVEAGVVDAFTKMTVVLEGETLLTEEHRS